MARLCVGWLLQLAAGNPLGWSMNGHLPWSEVGNWSQWANTTYISDGVNYNNVKSSISREQEGVTLTLTYTPGEGNYSIAYIYTYFEVKERSCVTFDGNSNRLPNVLNTSTVDAEFAVFAWSTTAPNPDWPMVQIYDTVVAGHQSFEIVPVPEHVGVYLFQVVYSINPNDGYYDVGSGSTAQLTQIKVSLGACVEVNESIVLNSVIGVFAFLFVLLILLLIKLHKRRKGGRYNVPLAVWWHGLDICTDFLFAVSMYWRGFQVPFILSLFFTFLPLFMHTVMGIMLFRREMKLKPFADWYASNSCWCNVLLLLMPLLGSHSIALLGSKLGGYIPLSAPFSDRGAYLVGMFTLITTLLEDIPQVCVQVVVAIATRELSDIVILSVTVSLLTVLFRLVRVVFDTFHFLGKQSFAGLEVVPKDPKVGPKWGDWIELWDDGTQLWYYENISTGETTWDKPTGWTVCDVPTSSDVPSKRCFERRRFQWPVTVAFAFFSLGMVVRYAMDPQNFQ